MVDIKENAVEPASRRLPVEPVTATRQRKEITFDKPAPLIIRQPASERQDTGLMPFDQRGEIVDDGQRCDGIKPQHRVRRVAEAQPANQNVHARRAVGAHPLKRDGGKGNFRCGEHIRHQVLVIQDDLDHITVEF